MITITILAVVILIAISIVVIAARKAVFHSDGTIQSIVRWTKHVLLCDQTTFTVYGLNKTNAALSIMFTMLSVVVLDAGIFFTNTMLESGTRIVGIGGMIRMAYVFTLTGCVSYAVIYGGFVMNRK